LRGHVNKKTSRCCVKQNKKEFRLLLYSLAIKIKQYAMNEFYSACYTPLINAPSLPLTLTGEFTQNKEKNFATSASQGSLYRRSAYRRIHAK